MRFWLDAFHCEVKYNAWKCLKNRFTKRRFMWRKNGSFVTTTKKITKYEDVQSVQRMERATHTLYRKAINSHWPFFYSDTQWFACILINNTYLSIFFFIGWRMDYRGLVLVAVVIFIIYTYFHLNFMPFESQFFLRGSFCYYNFHFIFFQRACVHFFYYFVTDSIFSALYFHTWYLYRQHHHLYENAAFFARLLACLLLFSHGERENETDCMKQRRKKEKERLLTTTTKNGAE